MKIMQTHQFYCTFPILCDLTLWRLETALCARLVNNSSGKLENFSLRKAQVRSLKRKPSHILESSSRGWDISLYTKYTKFCTKMLGTPAKSHGREGRVKCSSINIVIPSRRKGGPNIQQQLLIPEWLNFSQSCWWRKWIRSWMGWWC